MASPSELDAPQLADPDLIDSRFSFLDTCKFLRSKFETSMRISTTCVDLCSTHLVTWVQTWIELYMRNFSNSQILKIGFLFWVSKAIWVAEKFFMVINYQWLWSSVSSVSRNFPVALRLSGISRPHILPILCFGTAKRLLFNVFDNARSFPVHCFSSCKSFRCWALHISLHGYLFASSPKILESPVYPKLKELKSRSAVVK